MVKQVPNEYLDKTPAEFIDYMLNDNNFLVGFTEDQEYRTKLFKDNIEVEKRTIKKQLQEVYMFLTTEYMGDEKMPKILKEDQKLIDCYHTRKSRKYPDMKTDVVEIVYIINDYFDKK